MKNIILPAILFFYFISIGVGLAQGSGNNLRFNGVNQYASVPSVLSLGGVFSVEAWVKPSDLGGGERVILSKGNSPANYCFRLVLNSGGTKVAFQMKGTLLAEGSASTNIPLPLNEWTHLAGTWDGNTLRLYVNGQLAGTDGFNAIVLSLGVPFTIANENNNLHFAGEMDEVRLWNNALTPTRIREWMCKKVTGEHPNYGNMMDYYKFDETSGTTILDSRGGNNGSIYNNPIRAISCTPLGDEVAYIVGSNPDFTLNGGTAGSFRVHNTTGFGTTDGIYIYKVNGSPNVTTPPLTMDTLAHSNGYFGVFKAAPPAATYDVTFNYSGNPLLASSGQENKIRAAKRPDNASPVWLKATSRMQVDTIANTVRIFKQTGTEYVLGFANGVYPKRAGAGNLLDFDGANEDINLGSFNELSGVSQFTFACWVNPDVSAAYKGILSINNGFLNSIDLLTGGDANNIYMRVGNGQNSSAWTAAGTLPAGKWTHVAGVFDGTQGVNNNRLKIYLDGVAVPLGYDLTLPATTSTNFGASTLRIGNYINTSFFDGKIDEVSIWNSALSDTDIRALMCNKTLNDHPQFPNLTSYYRFDENVGNTLFDLMGNNDGTLQNMEATDWQNSTAPIGDLSAFRYDVGTTITLSDGSTDSFTANFVSLSAGNAIHIYKVLDAITATPPAGMASLDLGQHYGIFQNYNDGYNISHTYRAAIYPQENDANLVLRTAATATTYSSFDNLPYATINPALNTLSRGSLASSSNRQFMIGFNSVPNAPSNLFIYPLSETSMKVDWQDNATDETLFNVFYDTTASFMSDVFTGVGLAANTSSVTITGLFPNKVYYFKVIAYNGGTPSAVSNIATAVPTLESGKAGRFNGNAANHYSSVPYNNTWGSNNFTMEMWVKTNTLGTGRVIFTNRDSGTEPLYSTGNWFNLGINSVGNVNVELSNGGTGSPVVLGSVKELTVGKWAHIAIVRNATEVRMYLDGKLETFISTAGLNNVSKNYNYWVGRASTGGNVWNGEIDEIRIWNTARTAAQINGFKDKPVRGNEANLVHYWNFDENLSTAFDRASARIDLNKAGSLSPVKSRAMHPFQSPTLAADVTACGTVSLRWRKDIITDFSKYRIFRGASPATLVAIDEVFSIADTTYTNTGVADGTYYYGVAGVDLVGQVGDTIVSAAVVLPNPAIALIVTSTNDVGCGSLREAINYANSNAGKDTIRFNIAGAAPWTIGVASDLPTISDTVVIDGTTQPGWSATDLVHLKGYGTGNGLFLNAPNCEVYGLLITDFSNGVYVGGNMAEGFKIGGLNKGNVTSRNSYAGIYLSSPDVQSGTIEANKIGTDVTGYNPLGTQGRGIESFGGDNVLYKNNLISGNTVIALSLNWGTGNTLVGNRIGTSIDGLSDLSNAAGLQLYESSNNTIEDNVISGNTSNGIIVYYGTGGSNGNTFIKNKIGTDVNGAYEIANTANGILLEGNDNVIGTLTEGNLLSGNVQNGIYISRGNNNSIVGNIIGMDKTNVYPVANGSGIVLGTNGTNVTHRIESNFISGNTGLGIWSNANGDIGLQIRNNTFGINKNNIAAPNGDRQIILTRNSYCNVEGNIIANNGNVNPGQGSAIICDGGTTRIRNNSIYCNEEDGISLQNGANGGIAEPTINAVTLTSITFSGLAWGDTIEVFKNLTCGEEDAEILHTTFVAYGDGLYSIPALNYGDVITATRTNVFGTSPISDDITLSLTYCASYADDASGSHISRVQLNTINQSSSCAAYSDFTSVSTTLKRYETYPLVVDAGTCNADAEKYMRVFIDWNQDGNFSGTGEEITPTAVGPINLFGSFATQNIVVPSNAALGDTRMRIVLVEDTWGVGSNIYITACGSYPVGETEDYTINIAAGDNMAYSESDVVQASTAEVGRGLNNQKIIRIDVVTTGYENPVALEGLTIKVDGSTDAATDVANYNLYYGDDFTTATLVEQSTNINDFASLTNPQVLVNGFNRFWVSFDVSPSATVGNILDARCTEVKVAGTIHTPTNTDPLGNRKIVEAMTFLSATATQDNISQITTVPSANQEILGVFIKTSGTGAAVNLTSLTFNTNGSTNPSLDVDKAKVWYTGSSPTFATTTQVGGTINWPNGTFVLTTAFPLGNGENYFWLTYDIRSGANTGDVVDAEFTDLEIEGTPYTIDETAPTGGRELFYYCPSYAFQVNDFKIDSVKINNTIIANPACAVYTDNTATVVNAEKLAPLNIEVRVGKCNNIGATYYGGDMYVWIDFNQDGDFNDAGEATYTFVPTENHKAVINSVIPITATEGNTRMRIIYKARNFESPPLPNNPCNFNYDDGETEDFTINILPPTPMSYVSSTVSQPNVADVAPSQINRDIIKIEIVTANYADPLVLEGLELNANGSTNPSNDVDNYKLWKGSNFATATLLDQNTDISQLMATVDDTLTGGTNTYWLSYDMAAGASYGNEVDAECTKIFLNTGSEMPTPTNPAGSRTISTPMGVMSVTTKQPNTSTINTIPASNQEIISVEIEMSAGAPIEISHWDFTTNGSTDADIDIQNAKLWYTGTSSTFATTTQIGATYNEPDGSFNFTTLQPLAEGINYFWLTYDVPTNATSGNVLDATCEEVTIDGNDYAPDEADPIGNRLLQFYCASIPNNDEDSRIDRVQFNTIDVTSPADVCETYTNNTGISTNVQRGQSYNLIVTAGTCNEDFDKYYKVFFDWNQDLDFDDADEDYVPGLPTDFIATTGDFPTLSVTIPTHANLGATRMRVVLVDEDNNISACGSYGFGETEDYTINIQAASVNCLSGNYTINSTINTGGTNFQSFIDFANKINTDGVCDAVVVDVVSGSGPYTEQVVFNDILGVSATNTVTINGNGETLQFAPTASNHFVLRLDSTDYFIIDSLHIKGTDADYGYGILLSNEADHNIIRRCKIDMSEVTDFFTPTNSGGIVLSASADDIVAGNHANYCTFEYNEILGNNNGGAYYGVVCLGVNITNNRNNIYQYNRMTDFGAVGFYMGGAFENQIIHNTLNRPNRLFSPVSVIFIDLQGGAFNAGLTIAGNKMSQPFGANPTSAGATRGIAVAFDAGGDSDFPVNIYNNTMNRIISNGLQEGIRVNGSYVNIYHNTLVFDNATPSAAANTRAYVHQSFATDIRLMNNNIVITRAGTGSKFGYYVFGSVTFVADHNNIYVSGTNAWVADIASTQYVTLADWQTVSSQDNNSISQNPMLVSPTDLRLQKLSPCINAGTTSFGTALDIVGNTRLCAPDIGAYEYRGEPSWASYDNVWIGCDNDNWHNPNNWNTGNVPSAAQTVLVPYTNNNPLIDGSKTARCLTLDIETDDGALVNIDVDGGAELEVTEP